MAHVHANTTTYRATMCERSEREALRERERLRGPCVCKSVRVLASSLSMLVRERERHAPCRLAIARGSHSHAARIRMRLAFARGSHSHAACDLTRLVIAIATQA